MFTGRLFLSTYLSEIYCLRTSKAARKASPIKINNTNKPTKVKNVGTPIHQASKLSLAWLSNSPKLGLLLGTPKPKKSKLVKANIAPEILNGNKAMTGVKLLGSMCRHITCLWLAPIARATCT